jgi:serine/threonine-protein kinase HipA
MNPTLNEYQALLINSSTNHAGLQLLLDSSEEYMIGQEEARQIIHEVKAGIKQWKTIALRLGIAKREIDVFEQVFNRFGVTMK